MKQHLDDAMIHERLERLRQQPACMSDYTLSVVQLESGRWAVTRPREDFLTGMYPNETVATFMTEQEAEAEARRLLGVTERSE